MTLAGAPDGSIARDQSESAFVGILSRLVDRVRGALGAALVDVDGETVDYGGSADPFALRVAAAHMRIVLEEARRQQSLSSTSFVAVRAARATYVAQGLPEGYAVVLWLVPRAGLAAGCRRALQECSLRLASEAGWPSTGMDACYHADIRASRSGRPEALLIQSGAEAIEIIGCLSSGLYAGERGWRIRLPTTGAETTIVREPGGTWYADAPVSVLATKKDAEKHAQETR